MLLPTSTKGQLPQTPYRVLQKGSQRQTLMGILPLSQLGRRRLKTQVHFCGKKERLQMYMHAESSSGFTDMTSSVSCEWR